LSGSSSNPAGRPGHDTDMGACILYLAGPGGVFLNGQIIYPDGGGFSLRVSFKPWCSSVRLTNVLWQECSSRNPQPCKGKAFEIRLSLAPCHQDTVFR
jgi:hypothetical protein